MSNFLFETARLRIRLANEGDAGLFLALWNDPAVMRFVGFPLGLQTNLDEIRANIARRADAPFTRLLVVERKEDGSAIGECKMQQPDAEGIAETDVKLLPVYWGNGYGVEVKRGLVAYLFEHTHCLAVQATPNVENIASIKMQEAVGAVRVGEGIFTFPDSMKAFTTPVAHYVYRVYRPNSGQATETGENSLNPTTLHLEKENLGSNRLETRRIIHLDLDAFYCAVEEQRDPSLKGKPFAVGGKPTERGVVSSCSYSARRMGVRSAMPMSTALRLCANLRIVSPHFSLYERASQAVMGRLRAVTPLVEQISIDEAFLDVSALPTPAVELARHLHTSILNELGLPNSVGIASNKLVAKIASESGKSQHKGEGPPNALVEVPPGTEAAFLAPLAVRMLWGVGPKTEKRLEEQFGVKTIGELAAVSEKLLEQHFGKHGLWLAQGARGIDNSPIVTWHEPKSISQETTFVRDVADPAFLEKTLKELSGQVASSLQLQGVMARTIKIKLRWRNFTTLTRQHTLAIPTDQPEEIARLAIRLLHKAWTPGSAVRLIGVGAAGLEKEVRQLKLEI